jgi:hypothetical protein
MPEVPDSQAPSSEEQQLSSEALVASQEAEAVAEMPAEEKEALENSPYKEGDVYSYMNPAGQSYQIKVESVNGDMITIRNTTVSAEAQEVSLDEAKTILDSAART